MVENSRLKEQFVVPGERLGVIEEFLPCEGTFEEGGNIYSKFAGTTKLDLANKTATVERRGHKPIVPINDAIVLATVTRTQKKIAQVEIFTLGESQLTVPFSGILHISSSSPNYQKSMKDVCKAGDIIRAKVINVTSVLPQITTIGREFGVIKAYCSECGQTLTLKDRNLQCDACGNAELRKIAEDYGKERN